MTPPIVLHTCLQLIFPPRGENVDVLLAQFRDELRVTVQFEICLIVRDSLRKDEGGGENLEKGLWKEMNSVCMHACAHVSPLPFSLFDFLLPLSLAAVHHSMMFDLMIFEMA